MYRLIFILSTFLWPLLSVGQCDHGFIKQLNSAVLRFEDHEMKVDTLNELAWCWKECNLEKAIAYIDSAQWLAHELSYIKGLADNYMIYGIIAEQISKTQADSLYHLALALRQELGDPTNVAKVYNNLGSLHSDFGDPKSAIHFFEKGIALFFNIKNGDVKASKVAARIYNNLGDAYTKVGLYEKAQNSLNKSLQIRDMLGDTRNAALTYLNLSVLYNEEEFRLKDSKKSREYLEKFFHVYSIANDSSKIAKYYLSLGNIFFYSGQLDSAAHAYQAALDMEVLNIIDKLKVMKNLGTTIFEKGDFEKALEIFNYCLKEFEKRGVNDEVAMLYSSLGKIYNKKGQYEKALKYYNKSLSLTDSLHLNRLKTSSLYAMTETLETVVEEEGERLKWMTIAFLLGVLLVLLSATFYVYRINEKRRLAEKDARLVKQEVETLIDKQALLTIRSRLEGVEQERIRIAKQLHDQIGVMISTAKLYFAPIDKQLGELDNSDRFKYEKATQILDETYEEVRRISHDMASPSLSNQGLIAELQILANRIEETQQLKIHINAHKMQQRLDSNIEVRLYRIIQETITNTLKYAQATEVNIELNQFDDLINVMIEDNGVGFDVTEQQQNQSGIGLHNIKSSIEELNGIFNIDSQKGSGTTVTLDIPI